MTNDEKMLINAIFGMSRSLEKIASELKSIKDMMAGKRKAEVNEAKKSRYNGNRIIVENRSSGNKPAEAAKPFDDKLVLDEIRSIRSGKKIT